MIVFNITIQVTANVHTVWKQWFLQEYLPALLAPGSFHTHQLVKVLEMDEEETVTYALQLYCDSYAKLEEFRTGHLPALRSVQIKIWGSDIFTFESVMEVIN